jgi:hypothetical protein
MKTVTKVLASVVASCHACSTDCRAAVGHQYLFRGPQQFRYHLRRNPDPGQPLAQPERLRKVSGVQPPARSFLRDSEVYRGAANQSVGSARNRTGLHLLV